MNHTFTDPRSNKAILETDLPARLSSGDIIVINHEPWRCVQCAWYIESNLLITPAPPAWALECAVLPCDYLESEATDANTN